MPAARAMLRPWPHRNRQSRRPTTPAVLSDNDEPLLSLEQHQGFSAVVRVGLLDEVGELAEQGRLGPGSDDLLDHFAPGEQVDGRYGHDPVLDHRFRILVRVDLDDVNAARVLRRNRVEHRADLAARAAPRRPVLHDHWPWAGQHVSIETLIGYFPG